MKNHWKPQHKVSRTPGVGLHVRRIPSELSPNLTLGLLHGSPSSARNRGAPLVRSSSLLRFDLPAASMIRAALSLSLNTKRANSGCVMLIGSAPCFASHSRANRARPACVRCPSPVCSLLRQECRPVSIPHTKSGRRRRLPRWLAPPVARASASWCSRPVAPGTACPRGYRPRRVGSVPADNPYARRRIGDRVGDPFTGGAGHVGRLVIAAGLILDLQWVWRCWWC